MDAFPFTILEEVKIKELARPGVVTAYFFEGFVWSYRVRYFNNGELKNEYFHKDELEKIKK